MFTQLKFILGSVTVHIGLICSTYWAQLQYILGSVAVHDAFAQLQYKYILYWVQLQFIMGSVTVHIGLGCSMYILGSVTVHIGFSYSTYWTQLHYILGSVAVHDALAQLQYILGSVTVHNVLCYSTYWTQVSLWVISRQSYMILVMSGVLMRRKQYRCRSVRALLGLNGFPRENSSYHWSVGGNFFLSFHH